MKKLRLLQLYTVLGGCGVLTAIPALGAPLDLAQTPAGTVTTTPPPPNLILTFDNSNSMNNGTSYNAPFDPGQTGSRIQNLRQALAIAFSEENVPDGVIRLGWNTINPLDWNSNANNWGGARDCSEFKTSGQACGRRGNIVRPLDSTHRNDFLNWVANGSDYANSNANGLQGFGNTPTIHGYYNALKQYDIRADNKNSPWAEEPGTKAGEYLTCRKSYVMLLTDGDYNRYDDAGVRIGSSYDLDNTTRTLGDNKTTYDPNQPYANIYRQTQNRPSSNSNSYKNHLEKSQQFNGFNTIADLAFHYWAKDIDENASNNDVKELKKITTAENGIEPFWNPKNDPATWQHVNTYTIGYGATVAGWNLSPKLNSGETLHSSSDLQKLMNGTLSWPHQNFGSDAIIQQEMMHAAINGRGKFYPARTQQDLVDAIQDMLVDVIPVPEQHVTSASGSTLSALVASSAFYAQYDSEKWSGNVAAVTLKPNGGVDTSSAPWGSGNTAASLLDARSPSNRNILTARLDLTGQPAWAGKLFLWNPSGDGGLSSDQREVLMAGATGNNSQKQATGEARLNYLRGARTGEGTTYRERATVLGDIINSNVWFMQGVPNGGYTTMDYLSFVRATKNAGRTDALFVGANDGMLHAFDADNGHELFAYVPLGSYDNLVGLTSSSYAHKYFVDGSPFTADFCKAYNDGTCSNWGTALVGFMGAGGKGFFILDVTDPSAVTSASVLMDTTSGYLPGSNVTDPDIGHIMQKPVTEKSNPLLTRQIARMNNGKWALVTGNGYNSAHEKAVLIIQYLDGSAPKKIYATTTANEGNGLSAPRLIDLNGDGRPDMAYAGDLKGNLYKFDLAGTSDSSWGVAGNTAMFTARSDSGAVQPITTAPVYQAHPSGGLMVVFGTGQNMTVEDRSDTVVQSFYSIYDFGFSLSDTGPYGAGGTVVMQPSGATLPGTRGTDMLKQTITGSGTTSRSLDMEENDMDQIGTTYRGWYLDLAYGQAMERERVVRNPTWFDGDLLDLLTDKPAVSAESDDPCDAVETSGAEYYTTVVNAITGNAPAADVWAGIVGVNRVEGQLAEVQTRTADKSYSTCIGPDCDSEGPNPMERNLLGRYFTTPSWRQMQ